METLDNNYRSDNAIITDEHRALFKDASTWMKTFSIIILILLGLVLLVFGLVFLFASDSVLSEIRKMSLPSEVRFGIEDAWTYIKLFMFCILGLGVAYYVGCVNLLRAGNGFSALSFNPQNPEMVKESFKRYRKFWTIYGYAYLIGIGIVIIFAILIVPSFIE